MHMARFRLSLLTLSLLTLPLCALTVGAVSFRSCHLCC